MLALLLRAQAVKPHLRVDFRAELSVSAPASSSYPSLSERSILLIDACNQYDVGLS